MENATIVIAWTTNRLAGLPNQTKRYPCAAVWSHRSTLDDAARAHSFLIDLQKTQGNEDASILEFPENHKGDVLAHARSYAASCAKARGGA